MKIILQSINYLIDFWNKSLKMDRMSQLPLQICLFTTTKGHWGIKDRYKATVEDLDAQIGGSVGFKNVHIKIDPSEKDLAVGMIDFLSSKGYNTVTTEGTFAHQKESHQIGFINDIHKMLTLESGNLQEYTLVVEDDWTIRSYEISLSVRLFWAINMLKNYSNLMQVRIPRFTNEFERINKLEQKHGIKTRAEYFENGGFIHGDWSNNPFICRTRDLRAAMILVMKNPQIFGQHSEHSISLAMKYLSYAELPFLSPLPTEARCFHQGSPFGEEDNLDQPLNSN